MKSIKEIEEIRIKKRKELDLRVNVNLSTKEKQI